MRTAMTMAKVGGGFGLVCGILYAFGGALIDLLTVGLNAGTLMAFGALVGMPLIFAALGFVFGWVIALLREWA